MILTNFQIFTKNDLINLEKQKKIQQRIDKCLKRNDAWQNN